MLRWIMFAAVVVALVGAATFMSLNATIIEPTAVPAVATRSGPAPRVEVSQALTHEFGTMPQQSTGTHAWEFKNSGDADLELWIESSTCSCTIAKLKSVDGEGTKRLVVKPHDSTSIDLEWETRTFSDDYHKGAVIGTNDPSRPSVSLNVHGKVYAPVIIFPPEMIHFDAVSNEEPHSAKFAVFSADRPQTKVLKLTSSRPDFFVVTSAPLSADERKQIKVENGYVVTVIMKPGMPLGHFLDELSIATDHPLMPEIKVSIAGNILGSITVVPAGLHLAGVTSSQGASRDLMILVRGGKPTKFEVASHPEKVEVSVAPDNTLTRNGRYKMTVTVPPGTAAGHVEGDIILKTDHPSAGELKVPVDILISNSGAA